MTKVLEKKLTRNAAVLLSLNNATFAIQKSVIAKAKKEFIMTLMECAKAIINGTIPLTSSQYNELQRNVKDISALVRKSTLDDKKAVLQKGGFLGALLGPIISNIVPGLLKSVLGGGRR